MKKHKIKNDKKEKGFRFLRQLIDKEQEEALQLFDEREEAFTARVYREIDQMKSREKTRRNWRPLAAYAAAAALLVTVVLLGVLVKVDKQEPPSGFSYDAQTLEKLFLQAPVPGFRQKLSDLSRVRWAAAKTGTDPVRSGLAWLFKGAFYKIRTGEYSKEELKIMVEKALCFDCPGRQPDLSPGLVPMSPGELNLENRIEVLKKKKMIDHFLNKSNPSKS